MAEQQERTSQARVVGIASIIWASSIFLSRVMGLIREQIIGRTLGASRTADLYFASFTLPDFLNYLLAAGALSIVFIPIFLAHLERGDHYRGWELVQRHRKLHRCDRHSRHRAAHDICASAGNSGCPWVQRRRRCRYPRPADTDYPAGPVLSCDRRPAVGGIAGAKPPCPARDGPAGLFGRDHRRWPRRRPLPGARGRRVCLGRVGRFNRRPVRVAIIRLPENQDALATPLHLPQSRSQTLSLAVGADHDRILDRRGRRVDRQEPGVISRGRQPSRTCNTAEH